MLEFDFVFPHSYQVEELREWPGTGVFSISSDLLSATQEQTRAQRPVAKSKGEKRRGLDRRSCIWIPLASR
jgi:hypothetical protein